MGNFKLDTKEKFVVITPKTALDSDNTAEELRQILEKQLHSTPKNVILNFSEVKKISNQVGERLAEMAAEYMAENVSFVLCRVSPNVKKIFIELELMDILNITPTESEAWDIVQMEEIERELLFGEE